MLNYMQLYTGNINSVCPHLSLRVVERLVQIPHIHAQCYGTPDCWYFDPATNTLYIWDLKYGWGIVEVRNNWQFISYADGILGELSKKYPGIENIATVDMRVVQPRPPHMDGRVRRWVVLAPELKPLVAQASVACHEALSDRAKLQSGDHCANCPAISWCPPGHQAAMNAMDVSFESVVAQPHTIDFDLKRIRQAEKRLKNIRVGMEAAATEMIVKGTPLKNWSVDRKQGKKVWSRDNEEIYVLGGTMGVDLKKPDSPITPTQAINAGIPASVIAGYSRTESSGFKLVETNYKKVQEILCKS
jgi:hypothetical protein